MNVYDYFTQKMGTPPSDDTLRSLEINSPCGRDCQAAIIVGASLHNIAAKASDTAAGKVYSAVCEIVEVFWRG